MKESLLTRPELKGSKRQVDDYIIFTSQFAAEEFQDAYEILEDHPPEHMDSRKDIAQLVSIENLKRIVRHLEDFYSELFSNLPGKEEVLDNYTFFVTLGSLNE
jgi:cytochrome P450